MRRVRYLQQVGFLHQEDARWELGQAGREYISEGDVAMLLRIMCTRNVGLRSLLYALSAGPMTLSEVSAQQLDTSRIRMESRKDGHGETASELVAEHGSRRATNRRVCVDG